MYTIAFTNQYNRNVKLCVKRGYEISLLEETVSLLEETGQLPVTYRPHKLSGKYQNCWECHIQSDWLLLWMQDDEDMILLLLATGTHSDLF
jgi:mRNA interferase YafQ